MFTAMENGPVFLGKSLTETKSWSLQVLCSYDMSFPMVSSSAVSPCGRGANVDASVGSRVERAPLRRGHFGKRWCRKRVATDTSIFSVLTLE